MTADSCCDASVLPPPLFSYLSVVKPYYNPLPCSCSPKSCRLSVSSRTRVRSKHVSLKLWGTTCWRTRRSRTTRPCWSVLKMSRLVSWLFWPSNTTTQSTTCCPHRLWVRQGHINHNSHPTDHQNPHSNLHHQWHTLKTVHGKVYHPTSDPSSHTHIRVTPASLTFPVLCCFTPAAIGWDSGSRVSGAEDAAAAGVGAAQCVPE